MARPTFRLPLRWLCVGSIGLLGWSATAEAQLPARSRPQPAPGSVDPRPENRVAPSPMLGQFRPTPVITVRGNGIIGGGYSPIGLYGGNNSMVLYGPISSLRQTAAPVQSVVRGYNGVTGVVDGTSFSNPFQPDLSPVQYPTRNSNYSGYRTPRLPNQSGNGITWVDQN